MPSTVMIKSDHVYGVPSVRCKDCLGVAVREVKDICEVEFVALDNKQYTFFFHKNNLEILE